MITRRYWWLWLLCLLAAMQAAHAEPIVISSGEFPPWSGEKLPDGGYVNHIVYEAFRRQGVQVTFRYTPWPRAMAELRHGNVQASSFWAHDEERDKVFLLSDPLVDNQWLLFHRSQTTLPAWRRLADLAAFRFGITRGYTYTHELWSLVKNGTLHADIVSDDVTALRELQSGLVDIVPMDPITEAALAADPVFANKPLILASDSTPLASIPAYLLVPNTPQGMALLQRFNRGLASLKADGSLDLYRQAVLKRLRGQH